MTSRVPGAGERRLGPGARLGPYEILGSVGSGGMGEVYRARDSRLEGEVAIKVLPADASTDPGRLQRFEQESKAAGALNHPNLLAVFDTGVHEGGPYIVFELLRGETLRQRLAPGPLPPRKAVEYAVQIAHGLAAAHQAGIVHRDLKPENVFVTEDGRIKILDFGLAKLRPSPNEAAFVSEAATASGITGAGTILGTVAYMSPEQAEGKPADPRSDIFSLGSVFYEMLSGRRAFARDSSIETMRAILKEDPADLTGRGGVPLGLEQIVRRCLEKRPDERFQAARDVAFALDAVSASVSGPVAVSKRPRMRWVFRVGTAAALLTAGAVLFVAGRLFERKPVLSYRQLTFRRGIVDRARFAPDGETIAYSARWEGKPSDVFTARLDLAEAQALSLVQGAHLDAQHGGEALVHMGTLYDTSGRLARVPLVGGTPRDVAEDVFDSDWGPTGDIAITRAQTAPRTGHVLEYPIGQTLLESPAERPLADPRVSPRGDRVAVVERVAGGMGGDVVVVDRSGHRTVLSSGWMDVQGLAWSPDGQEVWFTAGGPARSGVTSTGILKELRAVSLVGRERLLLRTAGDLTLWDVFRDGRALLSHGRMRVECRGKLAEDEKERDLTYLDGTIACEISGDGRAQLFQEAGQAGGPQNAIYLRRVGDSSPIRIGEGEPLALSLDGRRIIALGGGSQSGSRLRLLSVGGEPPRDLPLGTLDRVGGACSWMPDGRRVIFWGREKDRDWRSYIQEPPDGEPQPISPEGTRCWVPGPAWAPCFHLQEEKGRRTRIWELRSLESGETRPALWIGPAEFPIAWSPDRRHAFVAGATVPPFRVFRVEVATGLREPWLDTSPPDAAGVIGDFQGSITPDGRYYAYSYARSLCDLFLVEGLR